MNAMQAFAVLSQVQYRPGRGSPVGNAPVFSAQSAPAGTVGVPYSYQFVANGAPAYSLGSGSFPAGLTLDPVTGILSGTPTTANAYTFTVNATNGNGTTPSTSQNVTISVGSVTSAPFEPVILGPGVTTSSSIAFSFVPPTTRVDGGPLTGGDAITGYETFYSTVFANATSASGTPGPTPGAGATTVLINSGLSGGTTYYVCMRTKTVLGSSADSNIVEFTTA